MNFAQTRIELDVQPLGCSIHPIAQRVAIGLVTGEVQLHAFAVDAEGLNAHTPQLSSSVVANYKPSISNVDDVNEDDESPGCHTVKFTSDGAHLVCGYSNRTIQILDSESLKLHSILEGVHEAGVSQVFCFDGTGGNFDGTCFASGDEQGVVKVWDLRSKQPLYSYTKHTDYISDFALHEQDNCLCTVSGDGTLSVHDLRTRKPRARSEDDAEDELLSIASVKQGRKLVCGTQSGVLSLFSWGYFNDCSDRFPGHPESVQALAKFDEDTLITGSMDGVLRIINVLPNRLIGVIGDHDGLPVECLSLSGDRRVLASVGHDQFVKLWDLLCLHDDEGDEGEEGEERGEEEDEEQEEEENKAPGSSKWKAPELEKKTKKQEEADGHDDGDEGEDGEEVNEEEEEELVSSDSFFDEEHDDSSDEEDGCSDDEEAGSDKAGSEEEESEEEKSVKKRRKLDVSQATVGAGSKDASKKGRGKPVEKTTLKKDAKGEASSEEDEETEGHRSRGPVSDSDSESDRAADGVKKRGKPERTKWSKTAEQASKGNFFADML